MRSPARRAVVMPQAVIVMVIVALAGGIAAGEALPVTTLEPLLSEYDYPH